MLTTFLELLTLTQRKTGQDTRARHIVDLDTAAEDKLLAQEIVLDTAEKDPSEVSQN